ncbi:MAG: ABC transporter ATP-binding protein [Gemmatimonadales bacterium]
MIRYEGFTKSYGRVLAVDGLELDVRPGETLALVGPNGSGKSTTLKAAVGLVRPTRGRVLVNGLDVAGGPEARAGLGYLPQRVSFPEGVTAREATRFYARLRGARVDDADRQIERVGLDDAADRPTDGYSGGMRQRLGIAIALLGRPRLLLLDEPSAALDPTGALLIRDLIGDIAAEGTTVLLSSHDLAEVSVLAGRVAIFAAGRLSALGTLAELESRAGARGLEAVYRRLGDGLVSISEVRAA